MSIKGSAGPILSIDKLALALRIPASKLIEVSNRSSSINYKKVPAPSKKDGTPRLVFSPSADVRLIQRRIVNTFFRNKSTINWPDYIFGGIHKDCLPKGDSRDYVACAKRHCGAKSALKLDIEDYFGNITKDHVFDVFNKLLKWSTDASLLCADLCTKDGTLPQGGITSSYIALLCLYDIEPKIVKTLTYKGLTYTRYVDDITVSSKLSGYKYEGIKRIIEAKLLEKGFTTSQIKTEHLNIGLQAISIHGVNTHRSEPELPKKEIQRIRSVCRQTIMDAKEIGRRKHSYRKIYNRSMGLINKLSRVNNPEHAILVSTLRKFPPLPSFADYKIATNVAFLMREEYTNKKHTHWYKKRYGKLMLRLSIIGIENKGWAQNLRQYMSSHFKPDGEEK